MKDDKLYLIHIVEHDLPGNAVKDFHVGNTTSKLVAEVAKTSGASQKCPNSGESGYKGPSPPFLPELKAETELMLQELNDG